MLRTLIVGLGRAGLGLHLPVLRRLRQDRAHGELLSPEPVLGYDPHAPAAVGREPGIRTVRSPTEALRLLDPVRTVVHVCTPPVERTPVLREFAEAGFRSFLVEKPLAPDSGTLGQVMALREEFGLRLSVVAPWLASSLTARLAEVVSGGGLGRLRGLTMVQRKARFHRSLTSPGHASAFDVEAPHSVGVALRLAGDAVVEAASWHDARFGPHVVPRLGTAALTLRHGSGTVTGIQSDLTSPVRERSVRLEFDNGVALGHYPVSEQDHYAHLAVSTTGGSTARWDIFQDDALTACLLRAYRAFGEGAETDPDLMLQHRAVTLLDTARAICLAGESTARNGERAAHVR